jgi:transcriptional regulator with XRE-family HTH domain
MKQPRAVTEFLTLVKGACPSVGVAVDHADAPDGDWWFDARVNGALITVFWSPKSGFGFSTHDEIGFGEKPNEIYVSAEMAGLRFAQLVKRAGSGRTMALGIAELRELYGLSQAELAKRVGVEQAAISRVEGRDNLELNTLRSLVEAMGLRLSVQVLAPGISANIEPGTARKKLAKVAKAGGKVVYRDMKSRGAHDNPTGRLVGDVFVHGSALAKRKVGIGSKATKARRSRSAAPGKLQGVTKS